ncbi:MAG: glycosyltransferase family A protein [Verrucomicrobiales bacterium]|nr:glycosyltransferase family A protein [Verrucomicrobiales bacterium]
MNTAKQQSEISIVFPLPDHRGYFDEILDSWLSDQTAHPADYEILLVSGPGDAALLHSLKPRLREHDKSWVEDSDDILYLMDRAARKARGKIILFSESHCLAHPECVQMVNRHFSDESKQLGQCFHINILENRYAELEQRLEGAGTGSIDEPYWNLVRKRGFAIRRELYLSVGGFPHEFRYFSERAFAYLLFREGHKSEFIKDAVIYHYNTSSLAQMAEHHQDYAEGMCLYRDTMPSRVAEEAFGPLPIWDGRAWYDHHSRSNALRAIFRSWLSSGLAGGTSFFRFALKAFRPLSIDASVNEVRIIAAAVLTTFSKGSCDRALHWYTRYWKGIVKRIHLRTISENSRKNHNTAQAKIPRHFKWGAGNLTDLPHWGFHSLETHDKREMRWTEPFAQLIIPVATPGKVELIITLHSAGPGPDESKLDVRLRNQAILRLGEWDEERRIWRGELHADSHELSLTFVCWKALNFPGDERELGFAVETIEVRQER